MIDIPKDGKIVILTGAGISKNPALIHFVVMVDFGKGFGLKKLQVLMLFTKILQWFIPFIMNVSRSYLIKK